MVPFKIIVDLPGVFTDVPPGLFVNAFHRWIQEDSVPDHLPIDVADYAHVAGWPGTILVCSEANIHVHSTGFSYVRKRPFADADTVQGSIVGCASTALELASRLETDPTVSGHFRLRPGELRVRFNDRLLTPNTAESESQLRVAVSAAIGGLFHDRRVEITADKSPAAELLEFVVKFG